MIAKTDSAKTRILEILAMTGEMSADNIKSFFSSTGYVEKIITSLKKESLIRKINEDGKPIYRLTKNGKLKLKEVLPDVFEPLLEGQKSMNRIREDKRRIERRNKLTEILLLFHRADIKIFPDEKILIKSNSVNSRADTTDITDYTDSSNKYKPEFYTAMEIKSLIPDYKTSNGSRALGILISYGKLYIIYSTDTGELIWRKETEKNFRETTRTTLARRIYGKDNGTYLLVFGEKVKAAESIMKRYNSRTRGKIHPSSDLPNMIFALKDASKDVTLKLITKPEKHIENLERSLSEDVAFDGHFPFFAGRSFENYNEYYLNAFMFDLYKVAAGIDACKMKGINVEVACFSYQEEYINSILDKDCKHRITFNKYYIEEGSESDDE